MTEPEPKTCQCGVTIPSHRRKWCTEGCKDAFYGKPTASPARCLQCGGRRQRLADAVCSKCRGTRP